LTKINLKNLLAIALILISCAFFSHAQTTDKGVIRGKVVEEIGGLAIPYAVVALTEISSGVPLQTLQTTETGNFIFEKLKSGIYSVKVSYIGYNNVLLNGIEINASDNEKNVGLIKLSGAQSNLNEVVITGDKPLIENDGDIITYNVGSSIYAEGSSAVDILKDVPLVEVDIDGKPTISGMRSTRIFINGRPSDYMTANITDLLNVLPSDAIEKIEVMTNPPAKYSADGEGIINIVLRKDFKVGFNGNLGAGVNSMGNRNLNTGASYRGKNYAFNGGGSIRQSFAKSSNKNYRTNFPGDTTYYYNQFSNTDGDGDGYNVKLGLDWDIDKKKKNNLKISTTLSKNNWDSETLNNFYYINEEFVEKRLRKQQNSSATSAGTFVVSADYSLRIDTSGQKIDVHVTANSNDNSGDRIYDYKYEFPANLSPYLQQNDNQIANKGVNFNVDYEKPFFNKRDRLEIGVALNIRQNDNDQNVDVYNFRRSEFTRNDRLSSNFIYNENILATYGSYSYRTKEWTARAALRAEYTNVNFDLVDLETYNVNPYWSIFPSGSLTRRIRKNITLGMSYGLRVNRPRENTLNPQINNADTLNISYGNPNLTPSYTHQLALNFGFYGASWSFNPRVTYSRATKVIERFRFVDPSGVSETTFDNVGSNYYLSYILVGNYRPTKNISINGSFTLVQSSYKSALNQALNRDGFSVRSRLGTSVQINKSAAFEGSLNYADNMVAQGRNRSSITTALGFRQNFLKNKVSARISATDPFRSRRTYSFSEGLNFYAESFGQNRTNNFVFNLSYRFSKIKTNKVVVPPAKKVIGKKAVKKPN
jgi:hypothetical protein